MGKETPRRPRDKVNGDSAITKSWEQFINRIVVPPDALRRLVEDSWRRCLSHGVNPEARQSPFLLALDDIYTLQLQNNELVDAARPVMTQAKDFLSRSGTVMVLADPSGIIIGSEGDAATLEACKRISLTPGANWQEEMIGTNAIGTALITGQPVQILAAEHFCAGIKCWSCSATAIRDPYDGRIVGVLDVSGLSSAHNNHCLALVAAGASRIESRLAQIELEKRTRLLDLALSPGRQGTNDGLLVFDRRGRMVHANEYATRFLNAHEVHNASEALLPPNWKQADRNGPGMPGLPDWLKVEWLTTIESLSETLGTLLVIPRIKTTSPALSAGKAGDEKVHMRPFGRIIGDSLAMTQVKRKALQLAKVHVPVLLLGPTGVGKELFAHAIHEAGPNPRGPFVPLNCGGMMRDLLSSQLFGYAEGAFTGARRGGMAGKFEAADEGTLFLDEISELPLELQAHFLRVLEDGDVFRLGENKARKVNVRVIAATNRDLRSEVAQGRFRMDLYYRLSVTVLSLPSLSERRDDIPHLVRHFIEQAVKRYKTPHKRAGADVMEALQSYDWPGNVRELRNIVEGMVLLGEDEVLKMGDLTPEIREGARPKTRSFAAVGAQASLEEVERDAIVEAIRFHRGNITRVAEKLGIAKSTLYQKMKRYRLNRNSL